MVTGTRKVRLRQKVSGDVDSVKGKLGDFRRAAKQLEASQGPAI